MNKTDVSYAVWAWINKTEVRCSNCKSLVGVAFCEESYEELALENKFCFNCGLRMLSLKNMISAIVEGVIYTGLVEYKVLGGSGFYNSETGKHDKHKEYGAVWRVKVKDYGKFTHGIWGDFYDCEVIGNIYENPELLETI